jgi:hypothetical protein
MSLILRHQKLLGQEQRVLKNGLPPVVGSWNKHQSGLKIVIVWNMLVYY